MPDKTKHDFQSGNFGKKGHHRVLIVDDEPAICFAYRKLLESESFDFDICEDTESARSLLKANDYFAIISDVRFAGSNNMDGVYFVSVVRKEQPEAKVILVTGYGSNELKKAALELGVSHYFEKPINPSLILSLLRKLHLIEHEREDNRTFEEMALTHINLISCLIILVLVMLPFTSSAALECSFKENASAVEVICVGEPSSTTIPVEYNVSKESEPQTSTNILLTTSQEPQNTFTKAAKLSAENISNAITEISIGISHTGNRRPQESDKVAAKKSRNQLISEFNGK